MSDYVRLTKQGLKSYSWDSESQSHQEEPIEASRVLAKLRCDCKIDPDTTLLDIFKAVEAYPALMDFIRQYSWCWAIGEFHNAARQPRPDHDPDQLTHLEIAQCAEISMWKEHPEYKPEINLSLDFSGIGKTTEDGGNRYGVSLTPMNHIAYLPVRIKSTCGIRRDLETEGEYETTLSLLEVLDAIYDEISFHGGPEESAEFLSEMVARVEEVEAGTAKLVSIDEVFGKETVN